MTLFIYTWPKSCIFFNFLVLFSNDLFNFLVLFNNVLIKSISIESPTHCAARSAFYFGWPPWSLWVFWKTLGCLLFYFCFHFIEHRVYFKHILAAEKFDLFNCAFKYFVRCCIWNYWFGICNVLGCFVEHGYVIDLPQHRNLPPMILLQRPITLSIRLIHLISNNSILVHNIFSFAWIIEDWVVYGLVKVLQALLHVINQCFDIFAVYFF